jgi:hypothetical protein
MPHEKIISGDFDGDGVEGHRKKITGGEYPRTEEEEHDFGPDPGHDGKRDHSPGRSKNIHSDDLFYTGFGSGKAKSDDVPGKKSVIGGDSDIFDTGFGSATQQKREKLVHVSGSAERMKQQEAGRREKKAEKGSSFLPDEVDELFESAEPEFAEKTGKEKDTGVKKSRKMDTDPFYTGFGYTDQRGKNSPADGGLFPEGDTLPEMPEKELIPAKYRDEEPVEEAEPAEEIPEAKSKIPEKPKKSVLTRDDDDLFS